MTNTNEILAAKKAQSLFEQALDLPHAERLTFVRAQCEGDAALFAEIKLLLDNEPEDASFLKRLYGSQALPGEDFALIGKTVDAYRLKEKLGRGGMAEVYLGQRVDGVYENDVAVKVIKGLGQHQKLVQRFHRERRILANLKHPNIAQLLDGGTTEAGLPYFVMEYVDGERIDTYCEQQSLSIKERLNLFLKVCSAVAFAHRNLVIHRDLKPANILVNGYGEPKLLDFGIAKLLDQDREVDATLTELAMTPNYASPEQLRGELLTTASDVYSLGILLYELLTGVHPNKFMRLVPLRQPQNDVTQNLIIPSKAVLEDKTHESTSVTLNASCVDAKKLSHALQGDLDTVVLKLLSPEPERRYDSVQALTEDINRYLKNLPILARRDSLWYRAHRFFQRNRMMSCVVSIALLTLAVSFGVQQYRVTKERDIAVQEREKFKQTQEFLVGLFDISDPGIARGNSITAREILDRGVEDIQEELEQQPETKSALLTTMGIVYRKLGLYDTASSLLNQALEIRKSIFSPDSEEISRSYRELARLSSLQGQYAQAEQFFHQALASYKNRNQENHINVAFIYNDLGGVQVSNGKYDLAMDYYQKSLAIKLKNLNDNDLSLANTYNNLGIIAKNKGENDLAIDYYTKSLAIKLEDLGSDHPNVASTYNNLGVIYGRKREYDSAVDFHKKAIAIKLKALGEHHPSVASSYNNLGTVYKDKGAYDLAIEYYDKSLAIKLATVGRNHASTANTYSNIGMTHNEKGDFNRAITYFEKCIPIYVNTVGNEHPFLANTYQALGHAYKGQGIYQQALIYYQKAHRIRLEKFGIEHPETKDAAAVIAAVKKIILGSL